MPPFRFVFIAAGVCRLLEHVRSGGSASLRVGKAMCGTLDLHVIELLPDITTGATIGIHRFSVYMKYNILETCASAVLKESCVTLHHLSRQLGRSQTIIWSPFRRTISDFLEIRNISKRQYHMCFLAESLCF